MRKLLLLTALCGLSFAVGSVGVAAAQVYGPEEWGGHGTTQCEPATHASYYDPRNNEQTVYNQDHPNWDNAYYVDPNVLADFRADGNYDDHRPNHDCDGTPVLRSTAYVTVYVQGELWFQDKRVAYPGCAGYPSNSRNPACGERKTGVYGGAYVANGDNSTGTGRKGGVANPFSEDGEGNLP